MAGEDARLAYTDGHDVAYAVLVHVTTELSALHSAMTSADVGVICLTRENLSSRWIHFESGAVFRPDGARARWSGGGPICKTGFGRRRGWSTRARTSRRN